MATIRTLKAGEAMPSGRPKRYLMKSGYINLRWRISRNKYVECREHRAVMGNPQGHVHHINHRKDDNRPENLAVMSPKEHAREHRDTRWVADAIALYASGMTTVDVGLSVGRDSSVVYRSLVAAGVVIRGPGEWRRTKVDVAELKKLHRKGLSAPRIAYELGVPVAGLRGAMKRAGLAPNPVGRPRGGAEKELRPALRESSDVCGLTAVSDSTQGAA